MLPTHEDGYAGHGGLGGAALRVSVVTVVRNRVDCIARAICSLQSQTWADVQHVVVDGGSTDGTVEVVRDMLPKDARWVSEPDRGIYDALNKGIAMCDGDLIGLLHSDDTFADSGVLETVARTFEQHPEVDIIYGDVAFFDAQDPTRCVRLYDSSRFRPSLLAWGWMPAHPSVFMRRRLIERHGSYRTDFRIAGDFEFLARVFSDPTLAWRYLPLVMVHMRTGGASTAGMRATLTLNREILRACRDIGIQTNLLKLMLRYPLKLRELTRQNSRPLSRG